MSAGIAIVGMACRYPDARSPRELWENVLAQRRAFRLMPEERLRLADYRGDRDETDCLSSVNVAVIEGYEFDRLRFKVGGETFRSADLAHWLALDVAAQTLDDAGFKEAEGLPRESTGVFIGNTLTGEFSRANTLRLRWPYVRRTIESHLVNEDWSVERRETFLRNLEITYKRPFPPIGEDSLAGGLSNTIAGRICNYFDLKGGGYTVDGACSSSLLAVANACTALTVGDIDVALAGGVDLSLDPFELVGFSAAGALATDEMRVYDVRSNGFWPGEGCGFLMLMRNEEAIKRRLRIYATIRGWGISSDGNGGITRPEVEGQLLALKRAYRRAGFGIDTVSYFEGHGTGTTVGDAVELKALSRARREANGHASPAAIGSVKANIGHTKAAAGVAGLMKAVMAVDAAVLPPATACEKPHSELSGEFPALRILRSAERWPERRALKAGVSSMGFGGIDVHVVIEAEKGNSSSAVGSRGRKLSHSFQDAELFLLGAQSPDHLRHRIDHLSSYAHRLSLAELTDLSAELESKLEDQKFRAAIVAATPTDLAVRLRQLSSSISFGTIHIDASQGIFLGSSSTRPRIGFLFPGQGSPSRFDGGLFRRRFDFLEEIYDRAKLEVSEDEAATSTAQPAIVTASMAGARVLDRLNIIAQVAVGHSLGELNALHWAGAFDEELLLRIARHRGRAMMDLSPSLGAMASIGAGADQVLSLINGEPISIAGFNSPMQTVISGNADAVESVLRKAHQQDLGAVRLPVSHAFHSPLVAPAAEALAALLSREEFSPVRPGVVSTVTGQTVSAETNVTELLKRQISSPVHFMDAINVAESDAVDLWLEVGPGDVLSGIMREITETPVVALDAGGGSLRGLLSAAAAAFVLGQPVNHRALFEGRFTRPFSLEWQPRFFSNPCESAPPPVRGSGKESQLQAQLDETVAGEKSEETRFAADGAAVIDLIRELVAKRAELPLSAVNADDRLLSDIHLSSIAVGQVVTEAARILDLPRPLSPTDFADVTVREVSAALEQQKQLGSKTLAEADQPPAGVDTWVHPFSIQLVEQTLRQRNGRSETGHWEILKLGDDALSESLEHRFEGAPGRGVVVCLSVDPDEAIVGRLLEAARSILGKREPAKFVMVQDRKGAAAFARTLHLEAPHVTTCVVTVPRTHPEAVEWVFAEAMAAEGFTEAIYDENGCRYQPVARPLPISNLGNALPLGDNDLLIVTGGGKGITAECVIALAEESHARFALVGLAQPESDQELSTNLQRMTAAAVNFKYYSADVTDAVKVKELVRTIENELGTITGIIHGAARNVPQLISSLDETAFRRTLAVKVQGARNLLAAVDPEKLRLLVTFGSIIARTGLPGESDYGLANEWLTSLTEAWKRDHPSCHCLAIEWSIWSGKGMGERLGRADRLTHHGITPIPPAEGVAMLLNLLRQPLPTVAVTVMSRFRDLPTFKIERPELPFHRFLEQPKIFYPEIELVVDAELSTSTDPYLEDHVYEGERLLPAVMGLEAMSQAAMAVIGSVNVPILENVKFNQPVIVPAAKPLKIRLAALRRGASTVEVVLRSAETAFHVNHFEATCSFEEPAAEKCHKPIPTSMVSLDPNQDLYGNILFQAGRFRRLANYRLLRATECIAEITADGNSEWFSRYLPGELVLGDPGARDAALHAIQACIPHATILPVGIDRLTLESIDSDGPLFAHATEISRDGNDFVYDLDVLGADGCVYERWEGLRLRAVAEKPVQGPWAEALLAPYIERCLQDLAPGPSISVASIRSSETDRRALSNRAIQMALGEEVEILRRPDGKPEVNGGRSVSASHAGDFTFAIAARASVSCDIELVKERTASVWRDLLGDQRYELARLVTRIANEEVAVSATRVWTAGECLRKIGVVPDVPVSLASSNTEGWVTFTAGALVLATYVVHSGDQNRDVLSVAFKSNGRS
ncbi:MAG: type I polyketide synthase [Pyrinomonadaceae bacterium]